VKIPHRNQLLLPLLETVQELGGAAEPLKVIGRLAERFQLPDEVAEASQIRDFGRWGTRGRYPWRQTVHWVRQEAATRGLIDRNTKGVWVLTQEAHDSLASCRAGTILIVYETPSGEAIWAEAITAAGALKDSSINLLFTSPPYPILRGRKYGVYSESEVIAMVLDCAKDWKRALVGNGSIVLNFRDVWLPKSQTGGAVRSLYQEKILMALVEGAGLYFADRLYWRNPSHSPESFWTTVAKVRLNQDTEHLFWFAKSPNPKANAERIAVAPKPSTSKPTRARRAGPRESVRLGKRASLKNRLLQSVPAKICELSIVTPSSFKRRHSLQAVSRFEGGWVTATRRHDAAQAGRNSNSVSIR
jgi:hypothetical protein